MVIVLVVVFQDKKDVKYENKIYICVFNRWETDTARRVVVIINRSVSSHDRAFIRFEKVAPIIFCAA